MWQMCQTCHLFLQYYKASQEQLKEEVLWLNSWQSDNYETLKQNVTGAKRKNRSEVGEQAQYSLFQSTLDVSNYKLANISHIEVTPG